MGNFIKLGDGDSQIRKLLHGINFHLSFQSMPVLQNLWPREIKIMKKNFHHGIIVLGKVIQDLKIKREYSMPFQHCMRDSLII